MATTNFIIVVLSVLSTIIVLCVALTKRNLQNVGSNKKEVTLRRKPAPKKTSRNLGASRQESLGGLFDAATNFAAYIASNPSTTTLTSGSLTPVPGVPTGDGVKSGGCSS